MYIILLIVIIVKSKASNNINLTKNCLKQVFQLFPYFYQNIKQIFISWIVSIISFSKELDRSRSNPYTLFYNKSFV